MEPGVEIETYESLSELRDKIDHYLAHDDERRALAQAGRARVLSDHTFERRMEDLLATIIAQEGESLVKDKKPKYYARNIVKKMLEEAASDKDLVSFLKQFDPEKPLSLKEVADAISKGKGALSRTESLMLMVNQLLVQ